MQPADNKMPIHSQERGIKNGKRWPAIPYELKEKLKQRAKSNGRSLNSELVQIVTDAVSRPSKISGYRDDAERIADEQSELVKKMVFDTLKDLYKKPTWWWVPFISLALWTV